MVKKELPVILFAICLASFFLIFLGYADATDLAGCANLTSAGGDYTLNQSFNADGTCFIISADNIILDGAGFTVTGNTTGFGVNNTNGFDNLTIKNFAGLNNFTEAVHVIDMENSTVYNNTFVIANVTNAQGIYLGEIPNASTGNNISFNSITSYNANGYGINTSFSGVNQIVSNRIITYGDSAHAVYVGNGSYGNNISENILNTSGNSGCGIYLANDSNWNRFYQNSINTTGNSSIGIKFNSDSNTTLFSNNISTSGINSYGIYLTAGSINNHFSGDIINASNAADLLLEESVENVFSSETLGTLYPTAVTFTYSGNFTLDNVENPPADSGGYMNISKYVNVTNQSSNSWIFLNVSYVPEDLPEGGNESALMLKNYSASWGNVTGSSVNSSYNYVYGNLTNETGFGIMAAMLPSVIVANPIAYQGDPVEGYDDTDGSVTFEIKCTDNYGVYGIGLLGDWTGKWDVNYSNFSYANDTWLNITVSGIPEGSNYRWAVACADTGYLTDISSNKTFDVSIGSESPGGGGGGGGGGPTNNAINVTNQTNATKQGPTYHPLPDINQSKTCSSGYFLKEGKCVEAETSGTGQEGTGLASWTWTAILAVVVALFVYMIIASRTKKRRR